MATEGMLLAGRDLMFLLYSYIANAVLVVASLKLAQAHLGTSIIAVWACILQFQAVRLLLNWWRLTSRKSCLNAVEVLVTS